MKQGQELLEALYTLKDTANSSKFTLATMQFLAYSGDVANLVFWISPFLL